MKTIHLAAISLLFLAIRECCFGVEDTNVIALGAWSEPVSNRYGRKLRGRFAMCAYPNHRVPSNRLDVGVYVDLQECSDSIGGDLEVYCDFAKGLKCELSDALGRAPEPVGFGYDGGAPGVGWLSLPPFSTVRLRATVFAGGRSSRRQPGHLVHRCWCLDDKAERHQYLLPERHTDG